MNYEEVLVEIWVPAAKVKKDMYLPRHMPIQQIMDLFVVLLPEIGASMFKIQVATRLYRLHTLEELSLQATCEEYHIENGETLFLL